MKKRAKTAFGAFLVDEIRRAGISQEEFYSAVGIKKPYFYDLLTAAPPPIEVQDRMLTVLEAITGIDKDRRSNFYNLAAQGRNDIPADISELIISNPDKWDNIRAVLKQLLPTAK